MPTRKMPLVLLETVLLLAVVLPFAHLRTVLSILKGDLPLESFDWSQAIVRSLLIVATAQVIFFLQDLYAWKVVRSKQQSSIRLLEACSYALVLTALLYFTLDGIDKHLLGRDEHEPLLGIYKATIAQALVVMTLIYFTSFGFRRAASYTVNRLPVADRLLMVGDGPIAETIERELTERAEPSYAIAGYIVPDASKRPGEQIRGKPIFGGYADIVRTVKEESIDRVIVCLPERRGNLPVMELLNCRLQGVKVDEGELLYERITGKIAIGKLRPSYLIFSEGFNRSRFNYIFKRGLDVVLALAALLLASPIIVVTSLLIKATSRGPILFAQTRVGREGRIFTLYKFRSMRQDAEKESGPVWAQADDDRVTAVGKVIRKMRIDEIPQFINVLKSEMSFVGPRPERPFFVEELKKEIPYYTERLVVKPGITGWAQINYRYGASLEDAIQKLQYDLYYIKNMSIFLDIFIMFRTVKVVLLGFGAR
ncbi:MAG: TIGR03013 family XrtA/PEP-CTERM system glycosyltransferase [Planctomycetota bacterium JB042]